MDNDKVINVLNDLIETCRDGQNGFKEAAENATSPDLKSFFYASSQERARFVGELQDQVRTLGGDPERLDRWRALCTGRGSTLKGLSPAGMITVS